MNRIYEPFYGGRVAVALLLLRFIVGLAFVFHGWQLASGLAGFAAGVKLPLWLAAVAAYTQLIGGILLILGGLTPLAAVLLAIEMVVALLRVHFPAGDPFVNPGGHSFELAAVYLFTMLAFLLTGPGTYSLDALLARQAQTAQLGTARRRGVA